MKKSILLVAILVIVLAFSMVLVACGDENNVPHACVDDNSDHTCDSCNTIITCYDNDKNHNCDICNKELTQCFDNNSDHNCEICGNSCTNCIDNDNNHVCETCGETITTCLDNNNDHNCDICTKVLSVCLDNDNNHNCDICKKTLTTCLDNNSDHNCDICNSKLETLCVNEDTDDHICDICGYVMEQCLDYIDFETLLCKKCGDNLIFKYTLKNDDTYEISGNIVPAGFGFDVLVCPLKYNGKAVTSIGDYAFENLHCGTLIISQSITYISEKAFEDLVVSDWIINLSSVEFSLEGVTIIDSYSQLSGRDAIAYLDEYKVFLIDNGRFYVGYDCFDTNGQAVIPQFEGEIILDEGAFTFTNVTSLVIGTNVKEIDNEAFSWSTITDIYYMGTEEQWNEICTFDGEIDTEYNKIKVHFNHVIEAHTCVDNDNGHYCDICGAKIVDCIDNNGDHNCDICCLNFA